MKYNDCRDFMEFNDCKLHPWLCSLHYALGCQDAIGLCFSLNLWPNSMSILFLQACY